MDPAKFKNQRLLLLDDLDQDFTVITKRAIAIRSALNVTRPSRSRAWRETFGRLPR